MNRPVGQFTSSALPQPLELCYAIDEDRRYKFTGNVHCDEPAFRRLYKFNGKCEERSFTRCRGFGMTMLVASSPVALDCF
jgi:hypothetical protein